MKDLISRQAAITTSLEFIVEYLGGAFDEDFQKELKKRLEVLPSPEPEQKKGKWDFIGWQMFQCSECKHTFTQDFLEGWREYTYESHFPPFCPNCGANMKGEQDE